MKIRGSLIVLIVIVVAIVIVCIASQSRRACIHQSPEEMKFYTEVENDQRFIAHAIQDGPTNAIYIRHGHDESSGYSHDQRLTEEGWREAQNLARQLIDKYGPPAAIYYSPFDRTTDTAKAMFKVLKHEYKIDTDNIKVKIEPRIGKYFAGKQKDKPAVSQATIERGMIVPRNKAEYEANLDKHHADIKAKHQGQVVWNITHAIGVNYHLKRILGRSFKVDYLQHITSRPE